MINTRMHNSNDYAALPDIDAEENFLMTNEDNLCLNKIGEVLLNRGINSHFGVSLLHHHFPINDDELMIEEVIHNQVVTSPKKKEAYTDASLQAINLVFSKDNPDEMIGLEYTVSEQAADVFSPEDEVALLEIRNILEESGNLNKFGVWRIHDGFNANQHKIMMESCNKNERLLSCELVDIDVSRNANTTQTFWLWSGPDSTHKTSTRACVRVCTKYSNGIHDWGIHTS